VFAPAAQKIRCKSNSRCRDIARANAAHGRRHGIRQPEPPPSPKGLATTSKQMSAAGSSCNRLPPAAAGCCPRRSSKWRVNPATQSSTNDNVADIAMASTTPCRIRKWIFTAVHGMLRLRPGNVQHTLNTSAHASNFQNKKNCYNIGLQHVKGTSNQNV
jgi:hypothetical protein